MSDMRARLADALGEVVNGDDPWGCDDLADVLLSLDGIAIVELPPPDARYHIHKMTWDGEGHDTADCTLTIPFEFMGNRSLNGMNSADGFRALAAALLAVANKAQSSSFAHGSAGDDRPPRSDPHQVVERGGLPTTIAAALQQLDELRDFTARELARLNSELSQAINQRDIARAQRDDARAQLFGMAP